MRNRYQALILLDYLKINMPISLLDWKESTRKRIVLMDIFSAIDRLEGSAKTICQIKNNR